MDLIRDYDNFFLPVEDLDTAKAFYGGILGLPLHFHFPDKGMTAYSVGSHEPALILRTGTKAAPAIWFRVDRVEDAYTRLKAQGVHFLSEPFAIATGRAVEFIDPFGNRLGLADDTTPLAASA